MPRIRLDNSRPGSKITYLPGGHTLEIEIRYDKLITGEKMFKSKYFGKKMSLKLD